MGEIWVDGPSKAAGYWADPERTEAAFRGRLDPSDGRFYLRTGDLGRKLPSGELVVMGRIKEVVIVRGRKYHPEDMENVVLETIPTLVRPGASSCSSRVCVRACVRLTPRGGRS